MSRPRIIRPPLVAVGQAQKGIHRLPVQPLALEHGPFFKGHAIAQVKLGQKIPLVQLGGLLQALRATLATGQAAVVVGLASVQQRHKGRRVQPIVSLGVELDRFSLHQQERRVLVVVSDGPAQIRERLAQVLARFLLGLFGP